MKTNISRYTARPKKQQSRCVLAKTGNGLKNRGTNTSGKHYSLLIRQATPTAE